MFELGTHSKTEHQVIVDLLESNTSLKKIFLVGSNFYSTKIKNQKISLLKSTEDLLDKIKTEPITDSFILIKGSRGMKLEQSTEFL